MALFKKCCLSHWRIPEGAGPGLSIRIDFTFYISSEYFLDLPQSASSVLFICHFLLYGFSFAIKACFFSVFVFFQLACLEPFLQNYCNMLEQILKAWASMGKTDKTTKSSDIIISLGFCILNTLVWVAWTFSCHWCKVQPRPTALWN